MSGLLHHKTMTPAGNLLHPPVVGILLKPHCLLAQVASKCQVICAILR